MKTTSTLILITLILIDAALNSICGQTAFTYQGRLQSSGASVTGLYDLQFSLYDSETGGSQIGPTITMDSVPTSNGLFGASLDFGPGTFIGSARWLQIAVKTNGAETFTTLSPRQPITPAPEAIFAANVPAGSITSTQLASNAVTGSIIANGQVVRSLNSLTEAIDIVPGDGLTLNAVGNTLRLGLLPPSCLTYSNCYWNLFGNGNITPGANFLGTGAGETAPLEFRVNDTTAIRYEPSSGTPNIIGGNGGNAIPGGVVGSIIAGGGHGGEPNSVQGDFATVSGGRGNTISGGAHCSTISGGSNNVVGENGLGNTIAGGSLNSTWPSGGYNTISGGISNRATRRFPMFPTYTSIGGGLNNEVSGVANTIAGGNENDIGGATYSSSIGGGKGNTIREESSAGTIGGGVGNLIGPLGEGNTISGGESNTMFLSSWGTIGGGQNNFLGLGWGGTIPGGIGNEARANSFAAGTHAKAYNRGAFVWADSSANASDLLSTNENSVTMRASGGYRLFSDVEATNGVYLASGSGSWTAMSDRNMKENFETVSAREVLEKVAALPVQRWNYKTQDAAVRHIGPTAQDFKAAFNIGESDTGIATVDADGIALAAIQGLYEILREKDTQLKAQNAELRELQNELKAIKEQLAK